MTAPTPIHLTFKPEHVVEMVMRAYEASDVPTLAQVQATVASLLDGPFAALRPHLQEIVEEVLHRLTVRIGTASVLDNAVNHEPWLESLDRTSWTLWPRLLAYLRDHDRLPPSVLAELDRSTDQALGRLESPDRQGRWDRRGLVVGHVQSGKTTHYTSLAAKAIDAGYRVVIILAGIHNSLRSQTHERIDRHLIGRDSCALLQNGVGAARLYGVGEYSRELALSAPPFSILTCTTAAEGGDFRTAQASKVWFEVNAGARLIMVVKKNATILRNLRDWLKTLLAEDVENGGAKLIHQPTLFIDDEADQASINTKSDPDADPTAINGLIRQLMMSFARVGLVGYTATPFANIFIDPTSDFDKSKFGPDLFPQSFIVSLKPPTDYIGPDVVFGHPGDESVGLAPRQPLPMYVPVADSQTWIPSPHKKDHTPGPIPASLREALRLFVVACAARAARGDERVHNSMLVHATRFIAVQTRVAEQVQDELATAQGLLSHGSPATRNEQERLYREVWDRHVASNHPAFADRLKDRCAPLPSWNEVWARLPDAARKIRVMKINGSSDDALAYARNADGLSVIAIGGDKLSRGLTLEGLSVSYFLRTSSMFDTLMQMGRWFGYRPRYADLCRVYTTPDLYSAFRQIALAIDDLRADLDRMALANRTPADFGLRVRTPSDKLLITAANKIRRGETVQVRFAGELVQALRMPGSGPLADKNRSALKELVEALPAPSNTIRGKPSPWISWQRVPVSAVLKFLSRYCAYSTHSFLNQCEQLRRYIDDRRARDELTEWTVCLVSKDTTDKISYPGITFGLRDRTPEGNPPPGQFVTRGVVGLAEESADLTNEEFADALDNTHEYERLAGKTPSEFSSVPGREWLREVRPPTRGLLLLYPIQQPGEPKESFVLSAAISFPVSPTAQPLTYTVNDIWRSEYGLVGDPDDDA
jgi:hypothetical protein